MCTHTPVAEFSIIVHQHVHLSRPNLEAIGNGPPNRLASPARTRPSSFLLPILSGPSRTARPSGKESTQPARTGTLILKVRFPSHAIRLQRNASSSRTSRMSRCPNLSSLLIGSATNRMQDTQVHIRFADFPHLHCSINPKLFNPETRGRLSLHILHRSVTPYLKKLGRAACLASAADYPPSPCQRVEQRAGLGGPKPE